MTTPKPRAEHIPSEEEFDAYLVNNLGVSPDAAIVSDGVDRVTAAAAALDERHSAAVIFPTRENLLQHHAELSAADSLPPHLRTVVSFLRRHRELFGATPDDLHKAEFSQTIEQNRNNPPLETQKQFEHDVAHLFSITLRSMMDHDPRFAFRMSHDTTVGTYRTANEIILETGDGMWTPLPRKHAGIVQCAPRINDIVRACDEIAQGFWSNAALLSKTAYNSELFRTIGQDLFGLTQDQLFTADNGIIESLDKLVRERRSNGRLSRGFGAMILSAVNHWPAEEIDHAIRSAPALLAPNGVLALSDLETFENGGSIWQMIATAREAFQADPTFLGLMTTDDGNNDEGRQAFFVHQPTA